MNRFRHFPIVCFITFSSIGWAGDDETTRLDEASVLIDGHRPLELAAQPREFSGIETAAAESYRYRPEFTANGKVLDITPLITLRLQAMTAAVRHASAVEKTRLSRAGMTRLQDLHRNEVVSTRKLQEQLAQWQTDRAIANETALQQKLTIVSSLQQWGNTLTDWFTRAQSPMANDIIANKKQLLQITLPPGKTLATDIETVRISVAGDRSQTLSARLVDTAPQVAPLTQGRQYFFLVDNADLPAGLHITASIPSQNEAIDGVLIPRDALLWHLGQTFVFIEIENGRFIRRDIDDYWPAEGGYFVSSMIQAGEKVVERGAQTLLSQQLRERIPDEDDD